MAKCRLISNFLSKTFPLLKWESMFFELSGSTTKVQLLQVAPGGQSRYLHCISVCGAQTQPSRPSRRQERSWYQLSCQSLRESPPSPTCLWWWGKLSRPTWTGRAAGRLPTRPGGALCHSVMNQAEEICFRSIISASNLSWPGWKEMFLQWGLLKKQYFQLCPRTRIYMFYKHVTLLARNIHSHDRDK